MYRQLLDQPNLIYIGSPIYKTGFQDLDFLILSRGAIGKILKTMIFMDKIDDNIQIVKYLYLRLYERIRREICPNHIIRIFITNLTTTLKTKFFANLSLDETQIWICIKYTGIGIHLLNICCII